MKVICDFDECLMPVRPASIYKITGETKPFKQYFEEFWERAIVNFSSVDGNQLVGFEGMTEKEKDAVEEFKRIKKANKSRTSEIYEKNNYYNNDERFKAPFLSIAEELLMALEEGELIEELFIISSNRREGKGAQGKREQFAKTFGKLPNTRIKVFVVAKAEGENKPHRWELIRDNYPDFDIFIDDNSYIIKSTRENHPADKVYVLPDYKSTRNLQASNIYHVKTTVSDLKIEDFEKAAQELKDKKVREDQSKLAEPKNYWPWIIGVSIVGGILIVGLIIYLLLRGKKNSPKQGGKT